MKHSNLDQMTAEQKEAFTNAMTLLQTNFARAFILVSHTFKGHDGQLRESAVTAATDDQIWRYTKEKYRRGLLRAPGFDPGPKGPGIESENTAVFQKTRSLLQGQFEVYYFRTMMMVGGKEVLGPSAFYRLYACAGLMQLADAMRNKPTLLERLVHCFQ